MSQKSIVVLDTSTVFNFGHRGQMEWLLARLRNEAEFWITPQVRAEIRSPRALSYFHDHIEQLVSSAPGIEGGKCPVTTEQLASMNPALKAGEISVLLTAAAHNVEVCLAEACLDEVPARRIAKALNIPLTGTLGLMKRGMEWNYTTDAQCMDALRKMTAAGFFVSTPREGQTFLDYMERF